MTTGRRTAAVLTLLAVLAAAGCRTVDGLLPAAPVTAHERYAESLEKAGLTEFGVGRDWVAVSGRALAGAVPVTLPFRETGYFPGDTAMAVAWRVPARRGQRLVVEVAAERSASAEPARLFLDLVEVDTSETPPWKHRRSADSLPALDVEIEEDTEYLVRLQPELFRSGRYTVTITSAPVLAFPVQGKDARAVQSYWGADRDAGRRVHQGIDIFADRGTPALAAVDGYVTNVGVNRLGGNVVWLRDERRGITLYYAHLDRQLVEEGQRVSPGDTIGTIGNTGNARTTPPHLHFGIYRRGEGPRDPYPYVHLSPDQPPAPLEAGVPLVTLARAVRGARLRAAPAVRADTVAELPPGTLVQILAGSGDWRRVALPDGRGGWLAARSAEPLGSPLQRRSLAVARPLLERPDSGAVATDSIRPGGEVAVLAHAGGYSWVRTAAGREGWLPAEPETARSSAGGR